MINIPKTMMKTSVALVTLVSFVAPALAMPVEYRALADRTVSQPITPVQFQNGGGWGGSYGGEDNNDRRGGYGGSRQGWDDRRDWRQDRRDERRAERERERQREWARDRDRRNGYYNGHRGYRERRPGYREHNGYWYPLAAFAVGAIIGGAVNGNNNRAAPAYGGSHVEWCSNRWRSYRASDNSYQPNNGPRRECVSPYMR